jgi:hypothetical protein
VVASLPQTSGFPATQRDKRLDGVVEIAARSDVGLVSNNNADVVLHAAIVLASRALGFGVAAGAGTASIVREGGGAAATRRRRQVAAGAGSASHPSNVGLPSRQCGPVKEAP